jgi:opacity protein-like surface antigen
MSFIQKLQVSLGLIFILTSAGAISVYAQGQTGSETSPVATNAAPTDTPKKAEVVKPSTTSDNPDNFGTTATGKTPAEKTPTDKTESSSEAPTGAQSAPTEKWRFVFSPYFWMAGLHGPVGTPNRSVQVDERFSDIFDSLKFAFMGVFEARKGKWGMQTDFEYVSLEDEKATPGPLFKNAKVKIKTTVFTPEVAYRLYDNGKGSFVQVLGGTRIWHISSDISFGAGVLPATESDSSRNWVDGVVGLRGKAALSEKVFVMGRFDVGGGGSKFTYQLFGGLGYNLNKSIALVFGYRDLDVNYNKNNFRYDTSQRGPIMGLGFRF